ncbi:MAG: hypothetical protein FJW51_04130, partial [Actinobacteria bacterium]|nr:hypothetical protein [Actinomycetota bacterium]
MLSLDGPRAGGGVSLGVDDVETGVEEVVVVSAPPLLVEVTLSESEDGVVVGAGGVEVSLDDVLETVWVSEDEGLEVVTVTVSDPEEAVSAGGVEDELVVTDLVSEVEVSTVLVSADLVSDVETTATVVSWV